MYIISYNIFKFFDNILEYKNLKGLIEYDI